MPWASITLHGLLIMVGVLWLQTAAAGPYRLTVSSPAITSEPLEAVALDIGTKVASLDGVSVRVSGLHTNGWWVGDPVENPGESPWGARLAVYVAVGYGIRVPGLSRDGWYEGRMQLTNDGAFTVSFSLTPRLSYGIPLPYVPDGGMALSCVMWHVSGLGTVVRTPYLALAGIDLDLEVEPVLEITSLSASGLLSWSALPAGGTVEILAASDSSGPWSVQTELPSEGRSTMVQLPQDATCRFYRLRWRDGGSP